MQLIGTMIVDEVDVYDQEVETEKGYNEILSKFDKSIRLWVSCCSSGLSKQHELRQQRTTLGKKRD